VAPLAWLELFGSEGAYYRTDLYAMMTFAITAPTMGGPADINGVTTINVWNNGQSGSDYLVLDKQQVVLPSEFWGQHLDMIRLTDAGFGEYHQRVFLAA